MNKLEETKIYGDDWEETMNQHMQIYTGCSIVMILGILTLLFFVVAISLLMGPN